MMVSTRGRYALRIMTDLAAHRGQLVAVSSIASRQSISNKYIEQIMTVLKRAGYVESTRGTRGGYVLSRSPSEYRVGDILRLMDGPLSPIDDFTAAGYPAPEEGSPGRAMWQELADTVNAVVDKYTVADLIAKDEK